MKGLVEEITANSANRCPNGAVAEKESSRRLMFQDQEK